MLYGGVFARHPNLTVVHRGDEDRRGCHRSSTICTRQSASNPALGDWPYDVSGGDMLRRNVKFTPLPGFGDVDALDVLTQLPEMGFFSSDYPHLEGNADPINVYGQPLAEIDPALRDRFLSGNASEAFARTGDPL